MAENSKIEWTDRTWNPITGCTRVSLGCDNCYAVKMTKRLEAMGQTEKYGSLVNVGKDHFNGTVKCHEDALLLPLKWRKPQRIFVNSMSDVFHKGVPFEFIDKMFAVMALCPHLTFQVLTKRPERAAEYFLNRTPTGIHGRDETCWDRIKEIANGVEAFRGSVDAGRKCNESYRFNEGQMNLLSPPLPNVWIGTSVEDQKTANERIPHLLRIPAKVRFLSCEPLLGPVDLTAYIGYTQVHEGGECGGISSHSSSDGSTGSGRPGENLEGSRAQGQPMERRGDHSPGTSPESRKRPGDIPPSAVDGEGQESERFGPPTSLDSLERPDSRGLGHQPSERYKEGQQAGESGVDNSQREPEARPSDWVKGSDRREESELQANRSGDSADTDRLCGWRGDSSGVGGDSRGQLQDDLQDRQRRTEDHSTGADSGLHGSSPDIERLPGTRRERPISWTIVGGESGSNARPMNPDWARSLRDQCVAAGVPFLFKQWGEWAPAHDESSCLHTGWVKPKPESSYRHSSGFCKGPVTLAVEGFCFMGKFGKKEAGRILDGRTWDEFPEVRS